MSLKIGIVGLPNVGKSTLFNALTKQNVSAENYPFCTIEPNVGIVPVPDERLDVLAKISKSEKIIPTVIEFVDIAGLARGAHKGEGLGNKFLSHIREVDAILHVARFFNDDNVIHVDGSIDASRDIETIGIELAMADLHTLENRISAIKGKARVGEKTARIELEILERMHLQISGYSSVTLEMFGKDAYNFSHEEWEIIKYLNLLTFKPMIVVQNVDEDELLRVKNSQNTVTICAKLERDLLDLPEQEIKEYLKTAGLKHTGLEQLITESYKILDLVTFLTTGQKETRAWTVKRGTKAPQAAGVIHTDFEKGFIRAEVTSYNDFVQSEGELGSRERGLTRIEGKEYIIKDGDVVYFRV